MANVIPVAQPKLVKQDGNMNTQRPKFDEAASQVWLPSTLVTLTSGALVRVATAGVLLYGLSPDGSHAATDKPPVAFNAQTHWPFNLNDNAILEISITTGGTVGSTATGAVPSAMTLGASYGLYTETAGGANLAPIGQQMLNISDTTNTLFTYVGLPDTTLATDINARVLVTPIKSKLQA